MRTDLGFGLRLGLRLGLGLGLGLGSRLIAAAMASLTPVTSMTVKASS